MSLLSKIPGWIIIMSIGGFLYFTGLHTEVIGKFQGILLYSGILKPDVSELKAYSGTMNDSGSPGTSSRNDFKLSSLSGEVISLNDLRGKVVFLNIWATWCPPCIAEMPNIQQLYEKVDKDEIAFVMLSLDKDFEKARKFIDKKGYTFPVYSPASAIPKSFNSKVIPTTYVIDQEGNIITKHEGMANYNTKEFIDFIKNLAKKI